MSRKTASRIVLPVLLSLGFCAPLAASAGAAVISEQVFMSRSQPLTTAELSKLYSDRTWKWNTGGARFSAGQNHLVAWVRKGKDESFAEGRWEADDKGQMCMRAVWTNKQGSAPARTCFEHRRIGNAIYQRPAAGGNWYIFKHTKPRSSDEIRKLVAADTISARAIRLKDTLGMKS